MSEELNEKIRRIVGLMSDAVTRKEPIADHEDYAYRDLYREIGSLLQGSGERHQNPFQSLREWNGYAKSNLPTYRERREHVKNLYKLSSGSVVQELEVTDAEKVSETSEVATEGLMGNRTRAKSPKPFYERWWFVLFVAPLLVLLVGGVLLERGCSVGYLSKTDNKSVVATTYPDLAPAIPKIAVRVGPMPPREDDIVEVPMAVYNNSEVDAYDLELDLLFSDGTGREGSLNDYLRSVGAPPIQVDKLGKNKVWKIRPQAISAPVRAKNLYSSGKLTFEVQLELDWKDRLGKQYRAVRQGSLKYIEKRDGYPDTFWFESGPAYSSISDPDKVSEFWGLPLKKAGMVGRGGEN